MAEIQLLSLSIQRPPYLDDTRGFSTLGAAVGLLATVVVWGGAAGGKAAGAESAV